MGLALTQSSAWTSTRRERRNLASSRAGARGSARLGLLWAEQGCPLVMACCLGIHQQELVEMCWDLGAALGGVRAPPCDRSASLCRFHNKGVYVRVGLQKISQSRSLHKEIRLQVGQQEVELPSIEGLIFINIPRCGRVGAPQGLCPTCSLSPGLGPDPGPGQLSGLPVHPLPLGTAGGRVLTCGVLTATRSSRSHEWTTGCWRWWG